MIKKVLIATDGSAHARKAVALGSDIASKYDAEVILAHVLLRNELSEDLKRMATAEHLTSVGGRPLAESIASVPSGRFPADMVIGGDQVSSLRLLQVIGEQIVDHGERIARDHGARRVVKRVEDGKPADRLLEIIDSEDVDLVVTGARGLSNLASMARGSVSHKLQRHASAPCLTVTLGPE